MQKLAVRTILSIALLFTLPVSTLAQGPMTECPVGHMMEVADMMNQMHQMMMDMGDMMMHQPMEGMADPMMQDMMMSMGDQTMAMGEMMGSMRDQMMTMTGMMGCP